MKNADAARAQVLAAAAECAECEIHAAIVHIEEHGDATYLGQYVDSWGWNEGRVEDMEIEELHHSRHWLGGWRCRDGTRPQLGDVKLLPGELLPCGALDDAVPDEQRLHEASGNEGVSLERAYRHAALVLWPRRKTLAIVANAGIGGGIAWVTAEFDRNTGIADERIKRLASELIDMWPADRAGQDKQSRAGMFGLLFAVRDKACTSRFLHEVILSHYTGSENEDLLAGMEIVGPREARRFLLALSDAHFTQRPKEILALLRRVDDERGELAGRAWDDLLREGIRSVLGAVSAAPDIRKKGRSTRPPVKKYDEVAAWPPRTATDATAPAPGLLKRLADQAVLDLFTLAWRWDLASEAETAAGAIAALPRLATPDRTLPAALRELRGEEGLADTVPFATLWRHATGFTAEAQRHSSERAAALEYRRRDRLQMRPLREPSDLLQRSRRQDRAISAPQGTARPPAPHHRSPPTRHRPRDRAPGQSLHPRVRQEPGEPPAEARRVFQGRLLDAATDPLRAGWCAGRAVRAGGRAAAGGGSRVRAEVNKERHTMPQLEHIEAIERRLCRAPQKSVLVEQTLDALYAPDLKNRGLWSGVTMSHLG